jgi:cobalt-zinc-cadmium efflux system outer membrane protein
LKYCHIVLFSILSGLISLVAWADTVPTLTLDEAVQTALHNNLQLKAARAQLNISEAAIQTAGARINPVFLGDNGIAEGTSRVGITQVFELGGKRNNRIALAKAQRDVAISQFNTRLLDIRSDVRRVYTQLYNAQERQLTYQNIMQVSQELVNIAKEREKAGDIAKLDVLQTEIVNVNAQNDLQTTAKELVLSRNRLNTLLKQPLKTTIVLAAPNTTPQFLSPSPVQHHPGGPVLQGTITNGEADFDSLIQAAYQRRPELQQINRNLLVTQREITVAKANRIPNFALTAGPDIVYKNLNNTVNQTSVFVTGTLEIPIFNRQQGPIKETLAKQVQYQQEAEALKTDIALEVTNAYTAYEMDQERTQRYEKTLLPYSIAIVDKSRKAFEEGKASILIPINAQQAYINTRLGYLQSLQDTQNDISDLERAIGAGL